MSKNTLIIWIVLFFTAAGGLGFYLYDKIEERVVAQENKSTGAAHIGGYFALRDLSGAMVTPHQFQGRYMLVYFGYSFCPDICPTSLENMSDAMERLGLESAKVQPIFITVDPARDTREQLEVFMKEFHPSFKALTGSQSAVNRAMKAYKVYAARADEGDGENYLVDHSSIVYFMGPEGKFVTHFTHQTPGHEMALKILEIIKERKMHAK